MTTLINKSLPQTESLHARIPQGILEELDNIANSVGRSRNWVFNEALKQYLDVQQWQLALIKERLSQVEEPTAKFILHDKVMDRQEKRLKKKLDI
ncbi:MAG TPA: ribbon-helix-helix protein, CopG family [Patescibacteria group bacterium]|nr:ribbon-helix-helix protein, CopG family [Patescibacteria group bacterium]